MQFLRAIVQVMVNHMFVIFKDLFSVRSTESLPRQNHCLPRHCILANYMNIFRLITGRVYHTRSPVMPEVNISLYWTAHHGHKTRLMDYMQDQCSMCFWKRLQSKSTSWWKRFWIFVFYLNAPLACINIWNNLRYILLDTDGSLLADLIQRLGWFAKEMKTSTRIILWM